MPLPNTNPDNASGETYNPNTAAMSQMGTSVNSVRKVQDQNQAIAKALDSLSAKISNITNFRTNVQSGIFEAFGNNFVSRGMNEVVSGISDSISSLVSPPEEPAEEDPTLVAIKQISSDVKQLSMDTQQQLGYSKENNSLMLDQTGVLKEISALAKNPRVNPQLLTSIENQQKILYKQEGTLKKILDFVTSQGVRSKRKVETAKVDEPVVVRDPIRKPSKFNAVRKRENAPVDVEIKNAKKSSSIEAIEPDILKPTVTEPEQKKPSRPSNQIAATNNLLASMSKDIGQSKITLGDILTVQRETNTNLSKLVSFESTEQKHAYQEGIKDVEQASAGTETEASKKPATFKESLSSMLDHTFNTKKISAFFNKPVPAKAETANTEASSAAAPEAAQQAESSILGDAATLGGAAAGGAGLSKIGKTIASGFSRAGKFIKGAALPAAIMTAGAAGVDALAGAAGVGKDVQINEEQDQANWDKMSFGQKIESGLGRGIEKAGSFLFMDNISNAAKAKRIKAETEYLNPQATSNAIPEKTDSGSKKPLESGYKPSTVSKSSIPEETRIQQGAQASQNLQSIEQAQRDINSSSKEPEKSAAPVVNTTNNINNQTIMPTRQVVKNIDDSYNRYLSSVLV